ncbi:MAG: glycine cleavage system protein GcvH [Clostridia bacterium]
MSNIRFNKSHEWLCEKDGKYLVGISSYAASELGDIVYVNLPEVGSKVEAGKMLCDIESVKASSEILSPANGTVVATNQELIDHPELINEDAYANWIAQIEVTSVQELLSQEEYDAMVK